MAEPLLRVAGLSAGYRGRAVITDIDVEVRPGGILGLLGANGSGKSTLLRAVTGQIRALEGGVWIGGDSMEHAPVRAKARFGLAVDPADLPRSLSGWQYLELVASIRGCSLEDWPCANVLERMDVLPWLDEVIVECSLGTRAKIAIAGALLGAPSLLIFDESLNGLDPVAAWEVKAMIRELAGTRRHAIIISTHEVDAVSSLCTDALLLADGKVVARWDAAQLQEASRSPGALEASVIGVLKAARQRLQADQVG